MPDLPKFPDNRPVIWKGKTWNKCRSILRRWRARAGTGLRERETEDGTFLDSIQSHPFKITCNATGTAYKLYVGYGRMSAQVWISSVTGQYPAVEERFIEVAAAPGDPLLGDPYVDGIPAAITLTTNTTYGVWVVVAMDFYNAPVDNTDDSVTMTQWTAKSSSAATVEVSTVAIDALDGLAMAEEFSGFCSAFFIGQIITGDGSSAAMVKQYRSSDITIGIVSITRPKISSQTGNSLRTGSDGALFVPPIVSSDSGQDISTGSDGGAYYDAP